MSTVPSLENESTMRISSHHRSERMQSAISRSSLKVVTIADRRGRADGVLLKSN